MPRDAAFAPSARRLPFTNPWPFLGVGLGIAVLVMLLHAFAPQLVAVRGLLVVAGTVTSLGGVGVRLGMAREDAEDRFKTAGMIVLAAAVPFLCALSLDPDWDSAMVLLNVCAGVGLASAGLLLLPRLIRRLTLTVLVLIHFGGILSAVGSPAPAGGQQSWLINQLWVGVYRPYLHFMYLNNAYHFYSPDPGPPILVWFRIEYEGGASRWIEVPGDNRSKLAFQRRLAMGESTNQLKQHTPVDFEDRWRRRVEAGRDFHGRGPIPPLNDMVHGRYFEYREPLAYSKRIIESYARYVLSHYPFLDEQGREHPELKPVKVKVYRVIHAIPDTKYIAEGFYPYGPNTYLPYYQGEFDAAGKQLDGPTYKNCQIEKPGDPSLYWIIPIKLEPKEGYVQRFDANGRPIPIESKDLKLVDYLKIHAGDSESRWEKRTKEAPPSD